MGLAQINTPLDLITTTTAATDQIILIEAERWGGTSKTALTPQTYADRTILADGDLTDSGSQTPTDTLATVYNAVKIKVTPKGTPTVSASTDGEVTIAGTDSSGTAITEQLDFETGSLTDAQTTEKRFATVTGITYDNWTAGDVDIVALDCRTGNIYIAQPLITEGDLSAEGTNIEVNWKSGSNAATKSATGPEDIQNGLTMLISGHRGTVLPFGLLTQDPVPNWHILNGSGKTLPSEVTVVNGAELDGSPATTVADTLASTTNPVQLKIALTSAALAATTLAGTITIVGTDHDDEVLTEIVSIFNIPSALAATQTTDYFYKTVTSVTPSGFTGGNYSITARDTAAEITLRPYDDDTLRLIDAEYTKGLMPNIYERLILQSASLAIPDRNTALQFVCGFLGQQAKLRQNLGGTKGKTARRSLLPSGVTTGSTDIITSWQCALSIGGVDFPISDATLTIERGMEYSNVISRVRYQRIRPSATAKRSVMIAGNIVYAPEIDITSLYRNNITIPDVVIHLIGQTYGGFPVEHRIEMDTCQFEGLGDPSTSGTELITQPFSLRSFYDATGRPSDYRIRIQQSVYDRMIEFPEVLAA